MGDIKKIGLKYIRNQVSLALLPIGQCDTSVFRSLASRNISSSNYLNGFLKH